MLEVGICMCGWAHTIVQRVTLRGNGCAPATGEVRNKPAVPQAALVVLRLRGASAIVASLNACSLGVGSRRIS